MTVPGPPRRTVVDLSRLLTHTSRMLATRLASAFTEIGITPREFCVLYHALEEERTQARLAELADLDKTTMVATVDELERAGLACRVPSPVDRRARIVRVTEEGTRMAALGVEVSDRVHEEVLATLPPGERDVLQTALSRLTAGILAEPADSDRIVRRPRQPI